LVDEEQNSPPIAGTADGVVGEHAAFRALGGLFGIVLKALRVGRRNEMGHKTNSRSLGKRTAV